MKTTVPVLLLVGLLGGCDRKAKDPLLVEWPGSKLLLALAEAPLEAVTAGNTNHVYRLICKRSLHAPFCIVLRVDPEGGGTLTRKILSPDGKQIVEQRDIALGSAKVQDVVSLVRQMDFWQLPSGQRVSEKGMDGAQWYLEAVQGGRAHLVSQWSPADDSAVGRIGRRLIELADWKSERVY